MTTEKRDRFMMYTSEGVVKLLSSSETQKEWDENIDFIMDAHEGQLPVFWFKAVIASGVHDQMQARFAEGKEQQTAVVASVPIVSPQGHDIAAQRQNALRPLRPKLVIKPRP